MNNYLIIFREPDGRQVPHEAIEIRTHQENWSNWLEKWTVTGNISSGSPLTLDGYMIKGDGTIITREIHKVGSEIIGGFLLLKADSLDEAMKIAASCPVFEFGGYAEVREFKK